MRAGILTFVRAYNYGAVLQCYALYHTLNKLDINAEVIDYYPEYFKNLYNFSYLGEPRYFPYRPIKNWIKISHVWSVLKKRNNGFDKFIRTHIAITKKQYTTIEELNNENFDYDMYISGSDQVWSDTCAKFDPVFFLQFNSAKKAKKASYAASFGKISVSDDIEEKKEEYKKRLANWDAYSIREQCGIDILNDLLGVSAKKCCDPTLLLTRSDWDKVRSNKWSEKKYILVYSVGNAPKSLYEYAKELSKQKKIQVIDLPCRIRHEDMMGYEAKSYGFKTISAADPSEWISLLSNAEYVLTDSFHGTVFSILYHKQFMSLVDYKWGDNNRIKDLLNNIGLLNRSMKNDVKAIDNSIEWESVDCLLELIRKESLSYINSLKSLGE